MVQLDFRGARGANVGDDFHELWALRQALTLLEHGTELTAMSVEGLRTEDEKGTPLDTWDGVDCALYYGGDTAATAERIELVQLKYSAANPGAPWTVARLTHSTGKTRDNSVLRRLATTYKAVLEKRRNSSDGLVVRLVSNQPVAADVTEELNAAALGNGRSESENRKLLRKASGLPPTDFASFAAALDLSRSGSRFALEESVLKAVAGWVEDETRVIVNDLLRFVQAKMMPETKGALITGESILVRLGFSDMRALFPCPSELAGTDRLIPRKTCSDVVERVRTGQQRICLHGFGGCGKTTALQEIERLLPEGSAMVVFDCYGGGRYLDSDAYRHRPRDAFLHLSNELATRLHVPLLLTRSKETDYPRLFRRRLDRAAEAVAAVGHDALLVIAVDAADNSIAGGESAREPSFVHDFVTLGNLPKNVRLLVTARSGRVHKLALQDRFELVELGGFTPDETAAHVRSFWQSAPDHWIADFHQLSQGNPRVQRYALERAAGQPAGALNHLLPGGKSLNDVFQVRMNEAEKKCGNHDVFSDFCAGLVVLPRPIPFNDLAAISGLTEDELSDTCADLAPGIRVTEKLVGFSDEDFEYFVRTKVEGHLAPVRRRVAERFWQDRHSDAYAATHVAAALHNAGMGKEVLALVATETEPAAIGDPVLRREVRLQRLRTAVQFCAENDDMASMLRTILIGAEAVRTNQAILELATKYPDLSAAFMRESAARLVLLDAQQIEHHGALLFHLTREDARAGNAIAGRENYRQLRAWMERRKDALTEHQREHPSQTFIGWEISAHEIAAGIEALLLLRGAKAALGALRAWHPRSVALEVARILVPRLIASGMGSLVEQCLAEGLVRGPWDLYLLVPLALSGSSADLSRIEHSVTSMLRRGLIRVDLLGDSWQDNLVSFRLDTILTACEVFIACGGNQQAVLPVLGALSDRQFRRADRLYTFQSPLLDLMLRAQALLLRAEGRPLTLESFVVEPEETPQQESAHSRGTLAKRREELEKFLRPLVKLYDARACILLGVTPAEEASKALAGATGVFQYDEYFFSRMRGAPEMRRGTAVAVAKLICVPRIDRTAIMTHSLALVKDRRDPLGADELASCSVLVLDKGLHGEVLAVATKCADEIREMKSVAREKADGLLRLSRFVAQISRSDADALFKYALQVTEEIDVEAVHQLKTVASMAVRAAVSMGAGERRRTAREFQSVISDAAIRLSGQEYFPWDAVAESLTTLDLPLALASIARWQDASVVTLGDLLETTVKTALREHSLTAKEAAALLPLINVPDTHLLKAIVEHLRGTPAMEAGSVLEEIARDELLCFGGREETLNILKGLGLHVNRGPWLHNLENTIKFIQRGEPTASLPTEGKASGGSGTRSTGLAPPLDTGLRYTSTDEIANTLRVERERARAAGEYLATANVLERLRYTIPVGDRVAHLNALAGLRADVAPDYEVADVICKAVEAWKESPAIRDWCGDHFPKVLVDGLPGFVHLWPYVANSSFRSVLSLLESAGRSVPMVLAQAIGRHVEELTAPVIYELVRVMTEWMRPEDTGQALLSYLERLRQSIPAGDLDEIDLSDAPTNQSEAIARFLFSLMSDCDVRIRWSAAHSIRRLARFRIKEPLDSLFKLYDRTTEQMFRAPNEPFYWLSARLWLVIALDRIASETPTAIAEHGPWLLEVARDESLPHVVIQAFVKDAAFKLAQSGLLKLPANDRKLVNKINMGRVPARSRKREYGKQQVDHVKAAPERRFHFNSMDTIPYWYQPAVELFAEVTLAEFLDVAENYILDKWAASKDIWRWDSQPRRHRFLEGSWPLSSNDHGSQPTLERFSTYLEWHVMCCAVGELMRSRPLTKADPDGYGGFDTWLRWRQLCDPPQWLSDFRGPKPLERQFWLEPFPTVDVWLTTVSERDFLCELGTDAGREGLIVIGAWHETASSAFRSKVTVRTALIRPETASALVRALQTVNDHYRYKIPDEGDRLEIHQPPYMLLGWLADSARESGIDTKDPFRNSISGVRLRPGSKATRRLSQRTTPQGTVKWLKADEDGWFEYEAWSDRQNDREYEKRSSAVESEGDRLWVSVEVLLKHMKKAGLDVIAEVLLTREKGDGGYRRYDQKESKPVVHTKILLLRADGSIEDSEGRVGTWCAPRRRTRA